MRSLPKTIISVLDRKWFCMLAFHAFSAQFAIFAGVWLVVSILSVFWIFRPLSPTRLDNNSLNSSFDLSQISNANVAERFSDEMNAWYKHKLQIDSSGGGGTKGKSTATLV